MKQGFHVYDTHTHLGIARHSGRSWSIDEMLRHMDQSGVDRSLLIPFPMVDDYRWTHDLIGDAVKAHPDRFSGAACLYPFVDQKQFDDEIKRCREDLGFVALKLQPQYQPLNPLSPRSDFLYEAAAANRLSVIVHTGSGVPFALPSLYIMAARRFPELPIVLAHCGGPTYAAEAVVAASVCPNIHLELSSLMPHHLGEVLAHVPSSRLMIGSDLPESVEAEIGKIIGLTRITDEVKRDILWNTPRRLFDGR